MKKIILPLLMILLMLGSVVGAVVGDNPELGLFIEPPEKPVSYYFGSLFSFFGSIWGDLFGEQSSLSRCPSGIEKGDCVSGRCMTSGSPYCNFDRGVSCSTKADCDGNGGNGGDGDGCPSGYTEISSSTCFEYDSCSEISGDIYVKCFEKPNFYGNCRINTDKCSEICGSSVDCGTAECTSMHSRCNGDRIREICRSGEWKYLSSCASDEKCVQESPFNTNCVGNECERDGQIFPKFRWICVGTDKRGYCSDSGVSIDNCGSDEKCSDGLCVSGDEDECTSNADCVRDFGEGNICKDGQCVSHTCNIKGMALKPGKSGCNPDNPKVMYTCVESGGSLSTKSTTCSGMCEGAVNNAGCVDEEPECTDGTPAGECSATKPYYCETDLDFHENCNKCSCPSDKVCKQFTGQCQECTEDIHCDDGEVCEDGECIEDDDGRPPGPGDDTIYCSDIDETAYCRASRDYCKEGFVDKGNLNEPNNDAWCGVDIWRGFVGASEWKVCCVPEVVHPIITCWNKKGTPPCSDEDMWVGRAPDCDNEVGLFDTQDECTGGEDPVEDCTLDDHCTDVAKPKCYTEELGADENICVPYCGDTFLDTQSIFSFLGAAYVSHPSDCDEGTTAYVVDRYDSVDKCWQAWTCEKDEPGEDTKDVKKGVDFGVSRTNSEWQKLVATEQWDEILKSECDTDLQCAERTGFDVKCDVSSSAKEMNDKATDKRCDFWGKFGISTIGVGGLATLILGVAGSTITLGWITVPVGLAAIGGWIGCRMWDSGAPGTCLATPSGPLSFLYQEAFFAFGMSITWLHVILGLVALMFISSMMRRN